jgi:hypothetical protein
MTAVFLGNFLDEMQLFRASNLTPVKARLSLQATASWSVCFLTVLLFSALGDRKDVDTKLSLRIEWSMDNLLALLR